MLWSAKCFWCSGSKFNYVLSFFGEGETSPENTCLFHVFEKTAIGHCNIRCHQNVTDLYHINMIFFK